MGEIALRVAWELRVSWRSGWPNLMGGGDEVGVLKRLLGRRRAGTTRTATSADLDHLTKWAATRRGVEAFVEPRTAVTETTVVLVAHDGEWTRRRVDGASGARRVGEQLGIPIYDVALVGYPQRMRDYTAQQRKREQDT